MRISIAKSILGCLLLAAASQAAMAGPWKIEVWQSGTPDNNVQIGSEFQIRGEGFHAAVHPIKVCVFDSQCQLVTPDRAGEFMLTKTLNQAGTYEIRAYQSRDMKISEWVLRAVQEVTVN